MPSLLGCPLTRQQCLWVGGGCPDKPLWRQFRGPVSQNSFYFIACVQLLIRWKPIDCYWVAHYLRSDSEHSHLQGLCAKEHIRGEAESVSSSTSQLPATHTTSEFSEHLVHGCYLDVQCAKWEGCTVTPAFSLTH